MKRFACGDVVQGCKAVFTASTDAEILQQVAVHAQQDHGLKDVSPELVAQVQSKIQQAPAA